MQLLLLGKNDYWWFEIHTGSEGYDEIAFIKRLITVENFLKNRGNYIVILPFPKDLVQAQNTIKKYNLHAELLEEKPLIDFHISQLIHFKQIEKVKMQMGFYLHRRS